MNHYGEKEVRRELEGEVLGAVSFIDGDLHLTFGNGRWVCVGINAQYCDHAWLTLQGMEGDELLWDCELWD